MASGRQQALALPHTRAQGRPSCSAELPQDGRWRCGVVARSGLVASSRRPGEYTWAGRRGQNLRGRGSRGGAQAPPTRALARASWGCLRCEESRKGAYPDSAHANPHPSELRGEPAGLGRTGQGRRHRSAAVRCGLPDADRAVGRWPCRQHLWLRAGGRDAGTLSRSWAVVIPELPG